MNSSLRIDSLAHPARYAAPWGRALRVISLAAPAVGLAALTLASPAYSPQRTPFPLALMWGSLLAVLAVAALFTIRGYRIEGDALCVERLLWTTRVPLAGLLAAEVERSAMRGSIRTCGNGGLFAFSGWWWSRRLGRFRAFVTDLKTNVVLRFADRTVVISPERPEEFVREILRSQGRSA